jgi:SAM-dependent methyltransferase
MADTRLEPTSAVREDFDRIAALTADTWNQNDHYHSFLLRRLPRRMHAALDIGCGRGGFSRLLAARADRVTAVDLSPQMVRLARERSDGFPNIDFQNADILEWDWPEMKYDCIASIATLHHLPLQEILRRCVKSLAAGGALAVLDLYQAAVVSDFLLAALALPAGAWLRWMHTGRLRDPRPVREAWTDHGRHERYLPLSEIRSMCAEILPGAKVRRHLLWRYSIIWSKPAGGYTRGWESPVPKEENRRVQWAGVGSESR